MGCSSCSSLPPENENTPPQKPNEEIKSEKSNSNKSDEESLKLSENEINQMMGELQLFLSFLQKRTANRET